MLRADGWCCVLVLVLVLVLVAKKWFFTELREMGAEWRCAETERRGRLTRGQRVPLPRSRETAFGFHGIPTTTDTRSERILRTSRSYDFLRQLRVLVR
jgi:hypothetical protein